MGLVRLLRGAIRVGTDYFRHAADPAQFFRSKGATIGSNVEFLGSSTSTLGSEPYLVSIGDGTTVSEAAIFITHDGGLRVVRREHPEAHRFAPIRVGANCFVGARAIVMPGVSIGDGAVVSAGSVVTADVAPGVVVAGNPARRIKTVEEYWASSKDRLVTPPVNKEPEKRQFLEAYFRGHP